MTILGLLLLLLTALGLGGDTVRNVLRYDRVALADGQWWRLFTAHLVHLNLRHLLFNLAGMALLWLLFAREFSARRWLAIVLCSMLAVDAGLWVHSSQVLWYVGASGVLHGLWSAGGLAQWHRDRLASALPALALLVKLLYEQWRGASAFVGNLPVVLDAHWYGALGGLALPLLWQLTGLARRRPL